MEIKAGIIGLGVGEQHIGGFTRSESSKVVALCDLDPVKREMAKSKYPDYRIYGRAEDLIDDPEINVVSIASYDHHHADQIVHALEMGKHVFAEKPLCLTENDLSRIRKALKKNKDLHLTTNTILRKSPRFINLKSRIEAGELGKIYNIEADYNYGRVQKIMDGWRGEIKEYSVMLGGGVHMIDLVLWLTGKKIIEVSALGNKFCSVGSKFLTPDMVSALVRFEDDAIGKVAANFGCVYPHFHRLSVYGTQATFENGLQNAWLYKTRDPDIQPLKITDPYPGLGKGDLIPGFVNAILGNGVSEVDEDAVFSSILTCLAIDRSLHSGKPERVLHDLN